MPKETTKQKEIESDKPEKPDPSKSALAQALAGIGTDESDSTDDPSDKKEEEKKETQSIKSEGRIPTTEKVEDKKEEQKEEKTGDEISQEEETALDSINLDKLVSRTGRPISDNAKENFDKLQKSRMRALEKSKKLEEKIKVLESQAGQAKDGSEEDLKKLKEENESYKQKINDLFFVESDEFKGVYEKPIMETIGKITKYIGSVDKSDLPEIEKLVRQADALLGDDTKEMEYVKLVDKIAEDYLPGSLGARFLNETGKLWELQLKKQEALKDKAKAREEVTTKLRDNSDRGIKAFKDRMGAELSAFELTGLGKFYTEQKEDLGYKDSVPKRRMLAERVISDFTQTGVVTPDLADMIMHGVFKDVYNNERKWLVDAVNSSAEVLKGLEEENKKMREQIKKLSATDKGGTFQQSRKEDDQDSRKGRSALADALQEAMNAA